MRLRFHAAPSNKCRWCRQATTNGVRLRQRWFSVAAYRRPTVHMVLAGCCIAGAALCGYLYAATCSINYPLFTVCYCARRLPPSLGRSRMIITSFALLGLLRWKRKPQMTTRLSSPVHLEIRSRRIHSPVGLNIVQFHRLVAADCAWCSAQVRGELKCKQYYAVIEQMKFFRWHYWHNWFYSIFFLQSYMQLFSYLHPMFFINKVHKLRKSQL